MYDIFEIETEKGKISFWKETNTSISIITDDKEAGLTINVEEFERLKKWINEDD